jgi:hypothetical protein
MAPLAHPTHQMDTRLIPSRCALCLATSSDPMTLAFPCINAEVPDEDDDTDEANQ